MKALMFTDIRQLQLQDVPRPEIESPDDVIVKVKSVGICGSDLHGYTGQSGRRTPPLIMGHEFTGVVETVGSANGIAPGQRVAIQPLVVCYHCDQCLAGQQNLCENRALIGMHRPGAYAEYVRVPVSNLYPIPDQLTYEAGAMVEPLSVAVHAVSLVNVHPYDTALIVGAGTIGLLTLIVLRQTAVRQIIVSDLSDARLEAARALGADITVNTASQNLKDAVLQHTVKGVDVAFEAVGVTTTAQQTVDAVRTQGTVVWIGNNQKVIEVDMQSIVTREISVLGSYGMNQRDFKRSLAMLADGIIPVERIINRRASLDEGPHLFDELLGDESIIKCVINSD
jgi:L-iditol 2-dehydrogenase